MTVCLSMERHSRPKDENGSIKPLMGQRIPGSTWRSSPEGRTETMQFSSLDSPYYWLLSGLEAAAGCPALEEEWKGSQGTRTVLRLLTRCAAEVQPFPSPGPRCSPFSVGHLLGTSFMDFGCHWVTILMQKEEEEEELGVSFG